MTVPVVLLDVDDVLVDFETEAEKLISDILGREWSLAEGPQKWDIFTALTDRQRHVAIDIIHRPEWSLRLKPFPEAVTAVFALHEIAEVFAVTSAISWASERSVHLKNTFDIDKEHQVYTKAKFLVNGDFFVDDCPQNVLDWKSFHPNGDGMVWDTRGNQGITNYEDVRVSSWDQVIGKVRRAV
jgi:5'(3')-deoxyribonucleotidase